MSVSFKCNHCDALIQAEESWAGGQTTCPVCGQSVIIPQPGQGAAPQQTINVITTPAQPQAKSGGGVIAVLLIIVAIIVFLCLVGAAMVLPALSKAREKSRQISCCSNMKQIGLAVLFFADEHDNKLPNADECKEKIMEFVENEKTFHCPSSKTAGDSYRFFVNGEYLTRCKKPSETILAICTCTHGDNLVNVLFVDGHVETLPKAKVDVALQNAARGTMPVLK